MAAPNPKSATDDGEEVFQSPQQTRWRQLSVSQMARKMDQGEKEKEQGGKRARIQSASPASTQEKNSGRLANQDLLEAIQAMIDEACQRVITSFEKKFEQFERRLEIQESSLLEQANEIDRLRSKVAACEEEKGYLAEQLESLDINNRMNCLIFHSSEFGKRDSWTEDIAAKVVDAVNKRYTDIKISKTDMQTVHRLQSENTVICKFFKTELKESLYEKRLQLAARRSDDGRRLPTLFVSESLTASKRRLFNMLLEKKKAGNLYTCFTRRGLVYAKRNKDDRATRIDTVSQAATFSR